MKMIRQHITVTANSEEEFQARQKVKLDAGWAPSGGVARSERRPDSDFMFCSRDMYLDVRPDTQAQYEDMLLVPTCNTDNLPPTHPEKTKPKKAFVNDLERAAHEDYRGMAGSEEAPEITFSVKPEDPKKPFHEDYAARPGPKKKVWTTDYDLVEDYNLEAFILKVKERTRDGWYVNGPHQVTYIDSETMSYSQSLNKKIEVEVD
jgi:hypothetical protein